MPKNFCCNLGSLNLAEFVKNPFTESAEFDFDSFSKAIRTAIEALDNLVDKNAEFHALKEQKQNSINYRNIGLGVMGYADMLMMLTLKYGDSLAKDFTEELFDFLFKQAVISSNSLAKEKGSFPKYSENIWNSSIIKKHFNETEIQDMKKNGLRNCSLISIAPTGSIATMLGRSGGCEPEFSISYKRKTESLNDGKEVYYDVFCKTAQEYINLTHNKDLPEFFVSSQQIGIDDRIETQGIMQRHVDTAISSTVNLDNSVPVELVEHLYLYAWKNGLKGITIYRDGCKRSGILTTSDASTKSDENDITEFPRGVIEEVPHGLSYRKYKLSTGCGKLYLFVGIDENDGKIYDCFTNTDGVGGCTINTQANSRLISACLRGGVPIEYIIDQLNKAGTCPSFQYKRGKGERLSRGKSCSSAIAYVLQDIQKEFENNEADNNELAKDETLKESTITSNTNSEKCPECGEENIVYEGGCKTCKSCGWSKCS